MTHRERRMIGEKDSLPSSPTYFWRRRATASVLPFLEFGTFGGVFDDPALGFKFVAEGVGTFEVFGFTGGLALFEQAEDLGGSFGGLLL